MIHQLNMQGKDKVQVAIDRLKAFEPPEGYYLAFSGGKDSVVIKAFQRMLDAHITKETEWTSGEDVFDWWMTPFEARRFKTRRGAKAVQMEFEEDDE